MLTGAILPVVGAKENVPVVPEGSAPVSPNCRLPVPPEEGVYVFPWLSVMLLMFQPQLPTLFFVKARSTEYWSPSASYTFGITSSAGVVKVVALALVAPMPTRLPAGVVGALLRAIVKALTAVPEIGGVMV